MDNKSQNILASDLATGIPVMLKYHRNLQKSPYMGERFGQHIEPHGEYISYHENNSLKNIPDYEYGTISFLNPLVIPWESTEFPMDHEKQSWGWKSFLSNKYGVIGGELSNLLISLGFDAVITTGAFGPESIGEIVNLSGIKKEN